MEQPAQLKLLLHLLTETTLQGERQEAGPQPSNQHKRPRNST